MRPLVHKTNPLVAAITADYRQATVQSLVTVISYSSNRWPGLVHKWPQCVNIACKAYLSVCNLVLLQVMHGCCCAIFSLIALRRQLL